MSDEHGKPKGTETSGDQKVEAPEPLWKQRGYPSEEAMVRELEADAEEAKLQAQYLKEGREAQKTPAPPVSDNPYGDMSQDDWEELYEENPQKAVAHLQKVAAEQARASDRSPEPNAEAVQEATIRAAVETAKKQAEKDGYDPEVVWAMMHSISQKAENQHLRLTREGVRKLADMAKEQIDGSSGKGGTPPEHQDGDGSGTTATGRDPFAKRQEPSASQEVSELAGKAAKGEASTISVIQAGFKAHTEKLKNYKKG